MEAIDFLLGALGGLLYALLGWLKSEENEPFNFKKLGKALVFGSVGGAGLAYARNLAGWEAFFAGVFSAVALNSVGKLVMEKIGLNLGQSA